MSWGTSDWNPSNWFGGQSGLGSSVGAGSSMANVDWSPMAAAGYSVPSTSDVSAYNNTTGNVLPNAFSSTDFSKLSSSLKDLSTNLKDSTGTSSTGSSSNTSAATSKAASEVGQPRSPVSMTDLVNMMKKRSEMYMQAAITPGTSGQPQQASRYTGLLGF